MEPNTNRSENTQQNPLQSREPPYFHIFVGQIQNPSGEMQQQFSEVFSSHKTHAENERLRLQHQWRNELQIK